MTCLGGKVSVGGEEEWCRGPAGPFTATSWTSLPSEPSPQPPILQGERLGGSIRGIHQLHPSVAGQVPGLINRVSPGQKTQAHFIETFLLELNLWCTARSHPALAESAILPACLLVSLALPGFHVRWARSPCSCRSVSGSAPFHPCSLVFPHSFLSCLQLWLPVIHKKDQAIIRLF